MPISFTPISNGKLWKGHDWSIDSDNELAELVARIALGQYRHVLNVLRRNRFRCICTRTDSARRRSSAIDGAERD